jgi:adenine phosphoribosyltransferase
MTVSNSSLDLTQWVRDVPDYPKPGILFRDLTPLMADPVPMRYVTDRLTEHLHEVGAEAVAAIDARGFIFAAPVAVKAGIPFIPLRKSGKLPPAVIGADYELEYGTARLEARHDGLLAGKRVVIIDDLLATGGTAAAGVQLLRNLEATVASCAFVVELLPLNGRSRFNEVNVFSLLMY